MEPLSLINAILLLGLEMMVIHNKEEDKIYVLGMILGMVGWALNLLALFKVI